MLDKDLVFRYSQILKNKYLGHRTLMFCQPRKGIQVMKTNGGIEYAEKDSENVYKLSFSQHQVFTQILEISVANRVPINIACTAIAWFQNLCYQTAFYETKKPKKETVSSKGIAAELIEASLKARQNKMILLPSLVQEKEDISEFVKFKEWALTEMKVGCPDSNPYSLLIQYLGNDARVLEEAFCIFLTSFFNSSFKEGSWKWLIKLTTQIISPRSWKDEEEDSSTRMQLKVLSRDLKRELCSLEKEKKENRDKYSRRLFEDLAASRDGQMQEKEDGK